MLPAEAADKGDADVEGGMMPVYHDDLKDTAFWIVEDSAISANRQRVVKRALEVSIVHLDGLHLGSSGCAVVRREAEGRCGEVLRMKMHSIESKGRDRIGVGKERLVVLCHNGSIHQHNTETIFL